MEASSSHRRHRAGVGVGSPSAPFAGHEPLESENSRLESELKGKIGALKSLTIDIGEEVRAHNRLLADTDNSMDKLMLNLNDAVNKVLKLVKAGGPGRMMLLLLLFCLFVMAIAWWIRG